MIVLSSVYCGTVYSQDTRRNLNAHQQRLAHGAMECHSTFKNDTMPSVAMWMDLEIIKLSEVRQREKKYTKITVCE